MDVFKNIIISLDFKTDEEQAKIDHAVSVAKTHKNTSFTLLTVVPKVIADPEKIIIPVEKQQKLLFKKAHEKLEKIAECFPKKNSDNDGEQVNITCLVKVGDPAKEIVTQVIRGQHDLLLISTRKQKSMKEHLLGGTSIEIMRQCPCPVWAVKPGAGEEKKIMVGLHFDEKVEDHNDTLNHELLRITTEIASKKTTELHLVNIINKADDELTQQRLLAIKTLVESDSFTNPSYEVIPEVLEGSVTTLLPDYAEQQSVDLLVMGMLSRTGLSGFFIGNTAEKIMDDVHCSLLVVKPKEFVSQLSI